MNKALDAEPPIAFFLKSKLIGGGPVNANVLAMRCSMVLVLSEAVLVLVVEQQL
ncbi:hypothetical protein Pla100_34980 [Neorhodopirellula pilleata]|uniref:Uncharacterized protein n=1 Tax=Neorhodopirellula pilleata TaxID=2714738 RepID=A0A5C6A9C2_9BACT|nr:hypothetical protein Pla100_34980 [Neorhodopirellula pilleata]